MLESFNTDKFEYKRLSPEEQQKRGILGRLFGIIADTVNATRNGRKYGLDLWKKVFDDPIMKEKIANRCVFCELGHPEDRAEIDMEKVCACLAEQPKIGKDGKLYGVFDILDTANGRILKTLCDYGTTVGISSRGTGDLYTDEDGNEAVDPDTYECECFDIVLIPAVADARLQYVTESYQGKTLKQALREQVEKSTEEDQKVMKETLKTLELDESIEAATVDTGDQIITINVEDKPVENSVVEIPDESNLPVEGDYIDEPEVSDKPIETEPEEAEEFGLEEIVEHLQTTLKHNRELNQKVEDLQARISVSNAKETKLSEELDKYKQLTRNLGSQVTALKEKLSISDQEAQEKIQALESSKDQLQQQLTESKKYQRLAQSRAAKIAELQDSVDQLQESLTAKTTLAEQYVSKLKRARDLVEKYKKTSQEVSNKYIESQAKAYGLDKQQILNRLSESFTVKDVENVCESLSARNLRVSRLPFDLTKAVKVTTEVSSPSILGLNNEDDVVDESLLRLANL